MGSSKCIASRWQNEASTQKTKRKNPNMTEYEHPAERNLDWNDIYNMEKHSENMKIMHLYQVR